MSPALTGFLIALLSATMFTSGDIIVKMTAAYLTVWQIVTGRNLGGALIMIIYARLRGKRLTSEAWPVLLIAALGGLGTFACLTYAFRMIPLAHALILLYTFPAFSAAFSPWLAKEPTPGRDWLLIGLAFAGTCIILWPDGSGPGLNLGHLLALGSGFCFGLVITLTRRVSARHSAITPYFFSCLVGGAIGLAVLLIGPGPVLPTHPLAWLALAGIAVAGAAAQVSANKAVQFLSGPKVGVILMAELVMGALAGALFFHEPITARLFVGSALILACGVTLSLKSGKR